MDISLTLLKKLGNSKIGKVYCKKLENAEELIKDSVLSFAPRKLSAYSIANEWDRIFKDIDLKYTNNFMKWYKIYYSEIGVVKSLTDQTRVLKFYKKLRMDFFEETLYDIKELGIYAPVLDAYATKNDAEISDNEKVFLQFINCLYGWNIICSELQADMTRETFEDVLRILCLDNIEFCKEVEKLDVIK